MRINVCNLQKKIRFEKKWIDGYSRRMAARLFPSLNRGPNRDSEINVAFVDDKFIRCVNRTYLKRNAPTDVIAFSYAETPRPAGESVPLVLGDVIISLERAKCQAKRYGKNFRREVALLLTHGVLHVIGYDDIKKSDRMRMREKERELLEALG